MCRNSSLYVSLEAAERGGAYPLPEFGGVYSPNVLIHPTKERISVITMAGYRVKDGRVDRADYPGERFFKNGMKKKIRSLLNAAINKKVDSVVLGAIGCGAYGDNKQHIPVDVVAAYAEVLNEIIPGSAFPYKNAFDNITFAILEGQPKLIPVFQNALKSLITAPVRQNPNVTQLGRQTPFFNFNQVGQSKKLSGFEFNEIRSKIEHALTTRLKSKFSFLGANNLSIQFTGVEKRNEGFYFVTGGYREQNGGFTVTTCLKDAGNGEYRSFKVAGKLDALSYAAKRYLATFR